MFDGSAACAGGVSRRERTRDSLVVVAAFKGGQTLNKQCE